jgi:hypothetical protein
MINTLKGAAVLWPLLAAATFAAMTPAFSQAPTEAQRAAIKSECRSDYIAHCSSIPPGGAPALQCLQKNMSSLAPGCQSAVRAVEAPAEPTAESKPESKPDTAPAATEAKPAQEPATEPATAPAAAPAAKAAASSPATKPSSAQISAIRGACRSDYPKVCAGVPTGGAPALQCLEKNKSKVSPGCQQAVGAASGGSAAATGAAPANAATASPSTATSAAAAAPPAALVLRPMRPREILFVLRSACGGDVRALCPGVEPGGGRIIECLATQAASLSPACKDVLGQFAAQ